MSEQRAISPIDPWRDTVIQWRDGMEIGPGVYDGIPNALYHAGPGISKSGLDKIDISPGHYWEAKQHPQPPTDAMKIGSALHCLVLEPHLFDGQFIPDKYPGSYTDVAKGWREAMARQGFTVIRTAKAPAGYHDPDEYAALFRMRDAVMAHPTISVMLSQDGIAERTFYWIDPETRVLCKCRPDWIDFVNDLCVDLKSTQSAGFSDFADSVVKYRYHVQAAFYLDGLDRCGHRPSDFVFAAVEKRRPHGACPYRLTPEDRQIGRQNYRANLRVYAACKAANDWPIYPDGRGIRTLKLPRRVEMRPIN